MGIRRARAAQKRLAGIWARAKCARAHRSEPRVNSLSDVVGDLVQAHPRLDHHRCTGKDRQDPGRPSSQRLPHCGVGLGEATQVAGTFGSLGILVG